MGNQNNKVSIISPLELAHISGGRSIVVTTTTKENYDGSTTTTTEVRSSNRKSINFLIAEAAISQTKKERS